jgi:signal transduction histidine kinase
MEERGPAAGVVLSAVAVAFGVVGLAAGALGSWAPAGAPGGARALGLVGSLAGLALGGILLGATLLRLRRSREREAFFAGALARLHGAHGFARALGSVLDDSRRFFRAQGVALAVREVGTSSAYLWAVPAGAATGMPARAIELEAATAADWLVESPFDAWLAEHDAGGWNVVGIDAHERCAAPGASFPLESVERLARRLGARRLAAADLGAGRNWEGRLVLADVSLHVGREESLRLVRRLVREAGGALQARFLLGRLRSRLGALERARVARELHDGTIQSLVAVEMEVSVLRRRAEHLGSPLAGDLARVQGLLRSEVLELRETMQRLKPVEVDPRRLVGFLDEAIARFARDTGIRAVFDCAIADVDLAPRVCQELARIVQEALHNVRKHSGASNVMVRFGRAPVGWRLVVEDDGRGFPFQGTLTQAELDSQRAGPFVIKERVRSLGGSLAITSSAGGGALLEVVLPREER